MNPKRLEDLSIPCFSLKSSVVERFWLDSWASVWSICV